MEKNIVNENEGETQYHMEERNQNSNKSEF